MSTRLRHLRLVLTTLARLIRNPEMRQQLREMRRFARALPTQFRPPLPTALAQLAVEPPPARNGNADAVRDLADLTALLDRRSPFGLCLRRSLTRYHFLRHTGVPVELQFGARFVEGKPDREVAAHAWVTLNGEPYHEPDENWRGFTVIFSWPEK